MGIAAFCEPLLKLTLHDLFAKAQHPERVFVGLVDQSEETNPPWLDAFPARPHITYIGVSPLESRGASWARSLVCSLYEGQDFFLQIDSHTLFDPAWDTTLVQQWQQLSGNHPKPIVSTYPPGFQFDEAGRAVADEPKKSDDIFTVQARPDSVLTADRVVLQFQVVRSRSAGAHDTHRAGFHVCAGFLFAQGDFIAQVPCDPYLYFHGEEQSLSLRAHAKGYQVFHPRHDLIPLYHHYRKGGEAHPGQHWRGDMDTKRQRSAAWFIQRSNARLNTLFTPGADLGVYGVDDVSKLESFASLCNIDYLRRG